MGTKTDQKKREAISLLLAGKSQQEVAEAIGVTRQTIWKWKRYDDFNVDVVEAGESLHAEHTIAVSALVDEAIGVMSELLKSEDESMKFKVAMTVMNSAQKWGHERPEAPGHTRAEGEINRERAEALVQIEDWKRKFAMQGGKPEDFTMWALQGMPNIKGNGAESEDSNQSAKPESAKPESAEPQSVKSPS